MPSWLYRRGWGAAAVLLVVLGLVTYGTWRVFRVVTEVTPEVATVYGILLGAPLATAVGLWKWRARDGDDDGRPD